MKEVNKVCRVHTSMGSLAPCKRVTNTVQNTVQKGDKYEGDIQG